MVAGVATPSTMSAMRSFNPRCRVGNWQEDIHALEVGDVTALPGFPFPTISSHT